MCFQLGWRTETWDLPDNTGDSSGATLYQALRAVYRERDPRTIDAIIRSSLDDEMTRLRQLGTENISGIREVARNIMCLGQITQWRSHSMQQQLASKSEDVRNLPKLDEINPDFEFTDLEQILATRISLVRSVRQKEERKQIGSLATPFVRGILDIEKRCLVRLSIAARKSNQLQVALNSIVKAQRLEKNASFEVAREFANVLWLQKEQKLAVQYLKDLVDGQNLGTDGAVGKALSFARLGDWIAEACLEKPTDIKRKFFDPAVELAIAAEKRTDVRDHACATVFRKCALFADQQYHSILKSPDAMRWHIYTERKKQEVRQREGQLQKTQQGTNEYLVLVEEQKKARTVLAEDLKAYASHTGARDAFLELAIDMYSRCLASSDRFDDDGPIRFSSLWFRISTTLASRTSSKALSIVCPPASLSSSLISCLLACPNHRQRSRRISKIFKDLSCACVKSILSTVCTRYSAYVQNNPKVCEGLPHDLSSHRRSRIAVELRAPFSIDCSAIPHKQRGSDRSSRSVMLLWSGLSILSSILR
jgi:ataxia telangiectasia mutated family protein